MALLCMDIDLLVSK